MGCFICILITYSPLRQFVNMCAGLLEESLLIIFRLAYIAINCVLKMFCNSGSLIANFIFLD